MPWDQRTHAVLLPKISRACAPVAIWFPKWPGLRGSTTFCLPESRAPLCSLQFAFQNVVGTELTGIWLPKKRGNFDSMEFSLPNCGVYFAKLALKKPTFSTENHHRKNDLPQDKFAGPLSQNSSPVEAMNFIAEHRWGFWEARAEGPKCDSLACRARYDVLP
jgi:hypothetical protein